MQSVHKTVDTKSRKICSVPQCSSYCTADVSLHAFPKDPKLCKIWQNILIIGKPITKYMLVCSLHFTENDFTIATNKRRRLKKLVLPSQKIPKTNHSLKKKIKSRSERHWLQKCTLNVDENVEVEEHEISLEVDAQCVSEAKEHATQLARTVDEPKTLISASTYEAQHSLIFYKDASTETNFSDFFELPQILNTDEKLINFTGINFDILNTITKCTEKTATFNKCLWKDIRTRLILCLCKLKMNISFVCLATLFKVSKSMCRNMFYSTISLLAVSLKPGIYWPSKEEILSNMPKCFDKYRDTRVVLDCTELKIQKLKCLKCRVRTYSHYKGTHTIKYLIGITPSGLISFISAGYGGRTTDKAIFNYENVIDKIDMYDAVMVDKGILIQKECEEKLVKLIRPPFLRKQKQFSKEDAEATADIARARVHVERAIQRIKVFKILSEQFNWYLLPYVDDIMTVIASVVNLSTPILADNKIRE